MDQNELYPIFLKAHDLNILIVGAGEIGLEKLSFLLKSSPRAKVTLVAKEIGSGVQELLASHSIDVQQKAFDTADLNGKHMVIAATNNPPLNNVIYEESRKRNLLVNVADNPKLCDFYLGGIVTKGNLKVAISTNGKSPSSAKRLRQFFEQVLPDDLDQMVLQLNTLRHQIKESLAVRTAKINELTRAFLVDKKN